MKNAFELGQQRSDRGFFIVEDFEKKSEKARRREAKKKKTFEAEATLPKRFIDAKTT
jgi:hypothetical protein